MLNALLAMQRRSWEQGLAGQAFLDLGRFDLAAVLAADAIANQLPDGRLADLGDRNVVNGASAVEPLLAVATRTGDGLCWPRRTENSGGCCRTRPGLPTAP